jgi:hypothetical protein
MNSSTSGWLVLTRNLVAGSHPQNDRNEEEYCGEEAQKTQNYQTLVPNITSNMQPNFRQDPGTISPGHSL